MFTEHLHWEALGTEKHIQETETLRSLHSSKKEKKKCSLTNGNNNLNNIQTADWNLDTISIRLEVQEGSYFK